MPIKSTKKSMVNITKKEMLKWWDRRITELALGLPEGQWKYSDKQIAQHVRRLIESIEEI